MDCVDSGPICRSTQGVTQKVSFRGNDGYARSPVRPRHQYSRRGAQLPVGRAVPGVRAGYFLVEIRTPSGSGGDGHAAVDDLRDALQPDISIISPALPVNSVKLQFDSPSQLVRGWSLLTRRMALASGNSVYQMRTRASRHHHGRNLGQSASSITLKACKAGHGTVTLKVDSTAYTLHTRRIIIWPPPPTFTNEDNISEATDDFVLVPRYAGDPPSSVRVTVRSAAELLWANRTVISRGGYVHIIIWGGDNASLNPHEPS